MKKNFVKKSVAVGCAFVALITGVLTANANTKKVEPINVVPTMSDKIKQNTAWCATFQLVWNEMKNELVKQDIIFAEMFPMVENLNKEEFTKNMLSDKYYYIKYGHPTEALKKEIEMGIKKKFNEKSNVLEDINWSGSKTDYLFYSMLFRKFEFEYKFTKLKNGKFGNENNDVKYFGIDNETNEKVGDQIDVLYYNNEDDFAIVINTKDNDELIFCKNYKGKTFNDIYENMNKKAKKYMGSKTFNDVDVLKVPYIAFNKKMQYSELENKPFKLNNPEIIYKKARIQKAIQTVEFSLDEKGGKVKSEAIAYMRMDSCIVRNEELPRQFNLDDKFTLFMREKGKNVPYFAVNVDDIGEFQ